VSVRLHVSSPRLLIGRLPNFIWRCKSNSAEETSTFVCVVEIYRPASHEPILLKPTLHESQTEIFRLAQTLIVA
jgi:hypothetical protein